MKSNNDLTNFVSKKLVVSIMYFNDYMKSLKIAKKMDPQHPIDEYIFMVGLSAILWLENSVYLAEHLLPKDELVEYVKNVEEIKRNVKTDLNYDMIIGILNLIEKKSEEVKKFYEED